MQGLRTHTPCQCACMIILHPWSGVRGGMLETGALYRLSASQLCFICRQHCLSICCLMCSGSACPVLCLGGGTPHKPAVLGATGHVLHESTVCADYLQSRVSLADTLPAFAVSVCLFRVNLNLNPVCLRLTGTVSVFDSQQLTAFLMGSPSACRGSGETTS